MMAFASGPDPLPKSPEVLSIEFLDLVKGIEFDPATVRDLNDPEFKGCRRQPENVSRAHGDLLPGKVLAGRPRLGARRLPAA
jgi:hypothetical protein